MKLKMSKGEGRYEKKFFLDEASLPEVETQVKQTTALFKEIYYERIVNNIYFDTIIDDNYNDNVVGIGERVKVRIRWYGEMFGKITKPILEFKIKNNELGKKISQPLKDFVLDENITRKKIISHILKDESVPKDIKEYMKNLKPRLLNNYKRKYYLSGNKKFRITLDFNQKFYRILDNNNKFLRPIKNDDSIILELKYEQKHAEIAPDISTQFPYRMTKSSKYVCGLDNFMDFLV